MGMRERAVEVLLSDTESFLVYWDYQSGWQCAGEGCAALEKTPIYRKGMLGLLELVPDDDRELCSLFLDRMQQGSKDANVFEQLPGKRCEVNLHLRGTDRTYTYYRVECHIMKEEGTGVMYRGMVEISPLTQEEIYRLRLAECITNDKNPQYFADGAAELMASHPDDHFALIQFDIAKFKVINEQYGEDVGDEILRFFIHTLKLILLPEQLYARLTADVFMILTAYTREEELYELIGLINQKLLGYKGIPYTLYFGVCEVKDRTQKLRKYGDGAAFARQSIKGSALEHVAFYRDDMKRQAKTQKIVEDEMDHALENHEFVMFLQPKYSISRNCVVGAEALVRWIHPKRGMIPPGDFVPLFEKNGFIIKMDQYIWEEACKVIRGWMDAGIEPVPISVNVSRRHLKDGRFVQVLDELVSRYGIEKRYLEIEITETVDQGQTQAGVDLLKEHGYLLLMDDFGSGYSSLNTLKDTQFDVIKIDREFLQDFVRSERGKKIVEHTIRMTRAIGLELVAEGVENQEQALFLSRCGCDTAQGYYYAKPMPVEKFNERLG